MSRFRMPAIFCVTAFVICEAISRPYAEMGVCDDWSFVRTAQLLAQTGHILYNGWAACMIGWQLYPAALFLRLFGFSFTAARLSTFLIAMLTTFLIQRTFVRAGINERNATIGTLAIVLTPLYMALSVTFMTDVQGLFAVVICLYGCLRALQASTSSSAAATGWICFAALANAIFGSSRQIAWLGVLVMVPCTLWLLRHHRRVLLVGCLATLVGWTFVALSLHWFQQQPYAIPEHVFFKVQSLSQLKFMVRQLLSAALEVPFLILPIVAAYLITLRRNGPEFRRMLAICGLGYMLATILLTVRSGSGLAFLQPLMGDWVSPAGRYGIALCGLLGPIVLGQTSRILLTLVSTLATFCAVAFLWELRKRIASDEVGEKKEKGARLTAPSISWNQLLLLTVPLALAYFALLIPRSSVQLLDRYLLVFMFLSGLGLIRAFQDFIRTELPIVTNLLVGLVAIYSIGATHDMFAFYRARVTVANEVGAAGIQPNTFDGGLEYNGWVELQQGGYVDDEKIVNPLNSYVPTDPYRGLSCHGNEEMDIYDNRLPHFYPRYGLSFYPNACAGQAALAPVSYFRWLGLRYASLYVVNYLPEKGY